jgi:hypothetical protein
MASFCSPTPFSRRVFSACGHLVTEAHALCARSGAHLAVVGVPDRVQLTRRGRAKLASLAPTPDEFDVARPDKELEAICRRHSIPFIPLSAHLTVRDYLLHDIHWRPSGHRKVAAVLEGLYDGMQSPRAVHPIGRDTASIISRGRGSGVLATR